MVDAAKGLGLDARVMDAQQLSFTAEFDAVFSNAALHWMPRTDDVLGGVARSLRPGGRFVGEFGGHGNVAAICTAIRAVLQRRGLAAVSPWYFPAAEEFAGRLEIAGFNVTYCELIPRPTAVPAGMTAWLETFSRPFLGGLEAADRPAAIAEISELLRPSLCDQGGRWTADYIRLRFAARRR
jgi:trans-aconitate methyltransferase